MNASKAEDQVKVVVTEGKVKLFEAQRPQNTTTLTAGESGSYNKKSKQVIKSDKQDLNDIAWKTQVITFNNTAISEVVKVLDNAYHVKIVVDEKIQNCTVTVSFDSVELNDVMKVLQATLNLTITQKDKTIFITGTGC